MTETVVASKVKKLTLFSVLPVQAILNEFESGFVSEPKGKEHLQSLWEKASKAYAASGPSTRSYATPDDIHPLEGVEGYTRRARFYPPYDSHPFSIASVRISRLVTPQITVNVSRAEKRGNVRKGMTEAELFELAFELKGEPESITRQVVGMGGNGGSVLFTSYDEDIRLHHPPLYRQIRINESDSRSPTFESVCMPVGGGSPFAAAIRIQISPGVFRLVLSNGIHRCYSLARAGYEWCPLIVVDLAPLEFPDPFVNMPKSLLLDPAANPPLITDFLNSSVTIPLDYHKVLKTVRLNWNFEQYATVLK